MKIFNTNKVAFCKNILKTISNLALSVTTYLSLGKYCVILVYCLIQFTF